MNTFTELEHKIDDTVELSGICRGEWCRALESEMDQLNSELDEFILGGEVDERMRFDTISRKMQKGYKNLSHDIHA